MKTGLRRVWLAALMIALLPIVVLGVLGSAAVRADDTCGPVMPRKLAWVRGYTFSGTVTRIAPAIPGSYPRLDPASGVDMFFTFRLDHVYAQPQDAKPDTAETNPDGIVLQAGGSLRLNGESCDGIRGFRAGVHYLVSVGTLSNPVGPTSAAWQLDGDQARLVPMYPAGAASHMARLLAAAQTLRDALALVAPEASLPPTSTEPAAPKPPANSGAAVLLALAALVGLLFGRRLRARFT